MVSLPTNLGKHTAKLTLTDDAGNEYYSSEVEIDGYCLQPDTFDLVTESIQHLFSRNMFYSLLGI